MLFFPELASKKNDTNIEEINCTFYPGMFFNNIPCLFHFLAPMNIIKYENRIIICFFP